MTIASPSHTSVALCVINYNGGRCIERTLQAAYAQDTTFSEIVLVDNASRDNSLALVRRKFPGIRILALPQNKGPGPARNAGLQAIADRRILFLDNDVLLGRTCAARLLQAMADNGKAAAAMPRILYDQNRNRIQYDGAYSHYLGFMILTHVDAELYEVGQGPHLLDSIVTACFLFDRTKWPDNQPFDDKLPIYYEDHDFGMRLRLAGNQVIAVPTARAFHGQGTLGLSFRRGGVYHPQRTYNLVLNRWQILLKNFEGRTLLLILPILVIYEIFQLIGLAKKGWLKQWSAAFRQIIAMRRSLFGRRRYVQRIRRTPDRAILRGGPIPLTSDLASSSLERLAKRSIDGLSICYWRCLRRIL